MSKQYAVSVKIDGHVSGAVNGIKSVSKHLTGLAGLQAKFANMSRTIGKVALVTTAVGGGIAAAMAPFVKTASDYETMMTSLGKFEGSEAGAKKAMDWISKFAVETPYELNDVSAAFVKLRAYGLEPTNGLLESLGNTASAMGKPLSAAVEMISDAITGENERLKEFGIKARKAGGKTVFEWVNNQGKQILTSVDNTNRKLIQSNLEMIMNEKYKGMMAKQAKTFKGMVSNLNDQWYRFKLQVMHGGAFDTLKANLARALSAVNDWAQSGGMQRFANGLSTVFTATIKAIVGLGPVLTNIGKAITPVWEGFAKFAGSDTKAIQLIVTGLAGLAALQIGGSILSFFLPTSLAAVASGLALTAVSTIAWSFALNQLNNAGAFAGLRQFVGGPLREMPSLWSLATGAIGRLGGGLSAVWAVVQNLHPALKILAIVGAVGAIAVAANWGKIAPILNNIWNTVGKVGQAIGLMVNDAIAGIGRWAMSFAPVRASMSWIGQQAQSIGNWFNSNLTSANRWADGVIAAKNRIPANVVPIAGARALGGPVSMGKPYLVGERGPELVVPRRNGYVVPNNQLGVKPGEMHIFIHDSGRNVANVEYKGQPAKITRNLGRTY